MSWEQSEPIGLVDLWVRGPHESKVFLLVLVSGGWGVGLVPLKTYQELEKIRAAFWSLNHKS